MSQGKGGGTEIGKSKGLSPGEIKIQVMEGGKKQQRECLLRRKL